MLSSSWYTMLKLFKTSSPQKLLDYDCVTLYVVSHFKIHMGKVISGIPFIPVYRYTVKVKISRKNSSEYRYTGKTAQTAQYTGIPGGGDPYSFYRY